MPLDNTIPFYSLVPWGRNKLSKLPAWGVWAQIGIVRSAPKNIPTPFCENRYRILAALAERCCYFCEFLLSLCDNRLFLSIFSVLHKPFTAFVLNILQEVYT